MAPANITTAVATPTMARPIPNIFFCGKAWAVAVRMAITPTRAAILRPISSSGILERVFIALANISTEVEIPTIATAIDPNPFIPPPNPENNLRNKPSSVIKAPIATTDFISLSLSIEDISINEPANIPIEIDIFKSDLASMLVFQDDKASRTPSSTPTIEPFISLNI